jgi:hypothetical protein
MSKNTQAHEWRHRGFVKLYEEYLKNREFYDKKYGADMGAMLRGIVDGPTTKNQSWSERKGDISEMAAEFFEKPEDFNMPAGYKFSDGTTTGGYNSGVKPITAAYEKENPQLTKEKTVAAPNTSGYLSDLETYKQKEFREYLKQPEDERESLFFDAMLKTQDFAKDLSSTRLGGEGTPSKYAQGGPVMRGIGTLNETARNMFRGPSGVAAYQHLANGGEAQFSIDQFDQDYRNERRKALRDSVKSGKTSLPVGILQHGANRIGEGVSDTVQGIGAFAKSLYNNPQAVAESGAEGLEALYNRVAQEDPMAAMEVAGMVATGGATAAIAKGARLADFATFDPNTSKMFIGDIGAKNLADAGKPVAQKVLQVARQMKMMGATETEIRAKTNQIIEKEDPSLGGVSFNSAGQLVVEIDDSKMAVRSDSAIARATGGYQTPAGGMYFSTDIDNVLKGTPLGKAYPNEINMKVSDVSEAPRENVLGSFDENTNTITSFALKTDVPGVTAHELQHFIQAREGFPRGGNEIDALDGMYGNMANDYDEISTLLRQFNGKPIPNNVYQQFENPEIMRASLSKIRRDHEGDDDAAADFAENQAITIRDDPEDWAKTIYSYLAGEVEARNVQTRLKMTPAERRATPPRETETDARFKMPLAREDQIISKRAQGGEVMQGVGSLNETARNMNRGPRGIGAYQQFAYGGPVTDTSPSGLSVSPSGPSGLPSGPSTSFSGQMGSPFGQMGSPFDPERYTGALPLSGLQPYPHPQMGSPFDQRFSGQMGSSFDQRLSGQLDNGFLGKYRDYLGQKYGAEDAAIEANEQGKKIEGFIQNLRQQEQDTFGGSPSMSATRPSSYPSSYASDQLGRLSGSSIYETSLEKQGPMGPPQGLQALGVADMPFLSENSDLKKKFFPALFASGGEAMGPPPTRGPDPQGIGAFQQFADGGPVYMSNGGDPFAEVDFDKLTAAVIQTESAGDPNAISEDDAIGLMQVLPSTGAQPGYEKLGAQNVFDIAIDLGFPIDDSERTVEKARELLFEPEINVTFGTKYLRAMIAHSGGDIKEALQKYNTGTGNYQAFVEGRKPLDQEAVRYPVLVANALTGGNLAMPEYSPFTPTTVQRGEDLIMSMPVAQSDAMSPLAIENRREGTEFQGQDAYSAGENLSRQTRQDFGSQAQQDDFEIEEEEQESIMEKYSPESMGEQLRGGQGSVPPQRAPMLDTIEEFFKKFKPPKKPPFTVYPTLEDTLV